MPMCAISIALGAYLVGRAWRAPNDQIGFIRHKLIAQVVPRETPIVSMESSAYVDVSEFVNRTTWRIEGWATFATQSPSLYVRSRPGVAVASAYLYERTDIRGHPGAIGFGIVLSHGADRLEEVCVLTKVDDLYYQIGGSTC